MIKDAMDRYFHLNDDDNDAAGENLGKRNVYRKLSNSELPQRAPLTCTYLRAYYIVHP